MVVSHERPELLVKLLLGQLDCLIYGSVVTNRSYRSFEIVLNELMNRFMVRMAILSIFIVRHHMIETGYIQPAYVEVFL